jgi:hypothetical protein
LKNSKETIELKKKISKRKSLRAGNIAGPNDVTEQSLRAGNIAGPNDVTEQLKKKISKSWQYCWTK